MGLFQSPYIQPSYRGQSFGENVLPAAAALLMMGIGGGDQSIEGEPDGSVLGLPGRRKSLYDKDQMELDRQFGYSINPFSPPQNRNQNNTFDPPASNIEPTKSSMDANDVMNTNDVAKLVMQNKKELYDLQRYLNSPETLAAQLRAIEPFEERRAQRQQQLGLQSNVAGFLLKGLPDMLIKAYASRAAYYPEMISGATRGLAEGFRAGAEASKPRFDYYQGLTS